MVAVPCAVIDLPSKYGWSALTGVRSGSATVSIERR
jgi:hypothetical protein